jgi:hypothetical protein
MTTRSFPVILGPRKPFNFRENQFKYPDPKEEKEEIDATKVSNTDFLQFHIDHTITKEGKI